jgi:VWFA-related protein
LAAATVLRGAVQNPPASPQQVFRAGTDVVMVDVSVRDDGRVVTGLNAADFVLTDNGVRQRIESVEAAAVPIDLTLAVDVSGNLRRPPTGRLEQAAVGAAVDREVRAITGVLRDGDRVRLLALDDYVQQLWPMQPASSLPALADIAVDGRGALYDTLVAVLLQPVEPARRHVVIVRTKGFDSISSVEAQAVRAVAERSDALFHLVTMEQAMDNEAQVAGFQCGFLGFCWPTYRSWVPFQRGLVGPRPDHRLLPDGLTLRDAAQATGGNLHQTRVGGAPSLTGTFRRAFDDFRSGYVLRYTPEGVARGGWHAIEVTVPRSRAYTVRARKGYGIEEAAGTPEPPPAPPAAPATLPELVAAYERDAYQPVVVALRQAPDPARLIRDFEEEGNPWPATPKREAAFALELAEAAAFSARAATRREAYDLLQRFTRFVRHPLEPDLFERYWHFAALTMLEGAIRPEAAEPFVERAIARFPDEPRFHLSRAILADQRWAGGRAVGDVVDATGLPTAAHVDAVRAAYEAAVAFPETAVEARIRLAWFLQRLERHDEALTHLTEAGTLPAAEPALEYLRQLFLGRVFDSLERPAEAVAAYRAALTILPASQSARVALMNTSIRLDDRAQAEALAEQVQAETDAGLDPFWVYWQAQYRLYPAVMARLREMSR